MVGGLCVVLCGCAKNGIFLFEKNFFKKKKGFVRVGI